MPSDNNRLRNTIVLSGIFLAIYLTAVACWADPDPNAPLPKSEVVMAQKDTIYHFKTAVDASRDLCEHGNDKDGIGFTLKTRYLGAVSLYNRNQEYLKQHQAKGPAEYPAKIPNHVKSGFVDWCKVSEKVAGSSCADDD